MGALHLQHVAMLSFVPFTDHVACLAAGDTDQKSDQLGMLQRAICDVFDAVRALQESGEAEVELRVQFVEVCDVPLRM